MYIHFVTRGTLSCIRNLTDYFRALGLLEELRGTFRLVPHSHNKENSPGSNAFYSPECTYKPKVNLAKCLVDSYIPF